MVDNTAGLCKGADVDSLTHSLLRLTSHNGASDAQASVYLCIADVDAGVKY